MLETRIGLIEVALGRIPPELIIRNIRLVNVYSGEIQEGEEVALWRDRIAYVGKGNLQVGPDTKVIDGHGFYLLPGFLDVHGHADFITNPLSLAKEILPTGTTGMLTDSYDICGALGVKGLEMLLKATEDIPFRYYFAAPGSFPPIPEFEGPEVFTKDVVAACLSCKRVLSLSEVTSWGRLIEPENEFLDKLVLAREHGKRVEGHMAGCSHDKINALAACGVTSCHESITAEEALEKLRLGLHVILRHGSIRADLEPLARLITENPALDTSRVMLSPDWFSPSDIIKNGYMNYLVAKAVEMGISPIKAIQMVTINPATYLGLDGNIGGIAPGRMADLLLVEDLKRPYPHTVIVGGKIVAEEGKLLAEIPDFPEASLKDWRPGRIPRAPVRASDFEIRGESEETELPCIHMVNKNITKAGNIILPVINGYVDITANLKVLKIGLWSGLKGSWITALLTGFGARVGGIASSISHDIHSPIVMGYSDGDMALAVNRMLDMGGGVVIVEDGQIMRELPLKVGGISSIANIKEVAQGWSELNRYLQDLGCPWDDPLFGMGFLTFTGLPYVRITPKGVVDIRKKEIIYPSFSDCGVKI